MTIKKYVLCAVPVICVNLDQQNWRESVLPQSWSSYDFHNESGIWVRSFAKVPAEKMGNGLELEEQGIEYQDLKIINSSNRRNETVLDFRLSQDFNFYAYKYNVEFDKSKSTVWEVYHASTDQKFSTEV